MARRVVASVFSRYLGMEATNSVIQLSLCQVGAGFMSKGASLVNIHFSPFTRVLGWVQTSAFEAESWPPLAYDVSMPA
jgi:hypothetical protein